MGRMEGVEMRIICLETQLIGINQRIDKPYEVVVRREEQEKLEIRVMRLEENMERLMRKAT